MKEHLKWILGCLKGSSLQNFVTRRSGLLSNKLQGDFVFSDGPQEKKTIHLKRGGIKREDKGSDSPTSCSIHTQFWPRWNPQLWVDWFFCKSAKRLPTARRLFLPHPHPHPTHTSDWREGFVGIHYGLKGQVSTWSCEEEHCAGQLKPLSSWESPCLRPHSLEQV